MSVIDVDRLLAEVASDAPCGDNLEYDPAFVELEAAARGKPEQQEGENVVPAEAPDWREVRRRALELLTRTKDLRVVSYLTRAMVETDGLVGLGDSLDLLRGLLEQRWAEVHPRLDPEDGDDPTMRINAIASLSDPETILRSIREAPLAASQTLGRYGLRDIQIATGELPYAENGESPRPELSTIDAAFFDCDLDGLRASAAAVERCTQAVAQIEAQLIERVGATNAPDLSQLSSLCRELNGLLSEKLSLRSVGESSADDGGSSGDGAVQQRVSGEVGSREDVIRVLDKVCDYYRRHEPSSPVPLLVQRARRLVAKDFMEIMRDLAPDGVSQAEAIAGAAGAEAAAESQGGDE